MSVPQSQFLQLVSIEALRLCGGVGHGHTVGVVEEGGGHYLFSRRWQWQYE